MEIGLSKKGKLIFSIVSTMGVIFCAVLLYFGYVFFRDRTSTFIFYNAYIIFLSGIVVYLAYRYIKAYI